MKTKRLVTDALCAAVYALLSGYVSVNLLNMKLSLDGLPILLGAILYGPADGLIIGLLGNFLGQLLGPYGLSVTTPLWMIPDAVRGLLVGLWAVSRYYSLRVTRLGPVVLASALVVTALNTAVMWADSRVFGYAFAATLPSLALRAAAALVTSVLFTLILPPVVRALERSGFAKTTKKEKA